MLKALARNWWLMTLRGVFAILFGIAAFVWPQLTITALVLIFGAYVMSDGLFTIISAASGRRENSQWWLGLLEGLAGIAAGLIAFAWPSVTAVVLLWLAAIWALVTGAFEILAAIQLRKEMTGEWLLALSGVLSIFLGILLVVQPGSGLVAMTWVIGAYAILFGIALVALSLRLRRLMMSLE